MQTAILQCTMGSTLIYAMEETLKKFDRSLGTSKAEQGIFTNKCKNKQVSTQLRMKHGVPPRKMIKKYGHVKAVEIMNAAMRKRWNKVYEQGPAEIEAMAIRNAIL